MSGFPFNPVGAENFTDVFSTPMVTDGQETLIGAAPQRKRQRTIEEQDDASNQAVSDALFSAFGSSLPGEPVPDFMEDTPQARWHPQMSEDEIMQFLSVFDQSSQHAVNFGAMHSETNCAATSRVTDTTELVNSISTKLERICWDQKQLLVPPQQADFQKVHQDLQVVMNMTQEGKAAVQEVLQSSIVAPSILSQIYRLQSELQYLTALITLYQEELLYIAQPQAQSRCFAALFIRKQPFSKSLKQNTKSSSPLEEPVLVEMISAPKCEVQPTGKVTASLSYDDFAAKQATFVIENNKKQLDELSQARFSDMRFKSGTRLKMVRLKFVVDVQFVQLDGSMAKAKLDSNTSEPFIVMTNENQWESAESMLIRKSLFPTAVTGNLDASKRVSWPEFANKLQGNYLKATRQDPAAPSRALSRYDMDYLHRNQFGGKPDLDQKDFDRFWIWFGRVMHKIRHQKPFVFLWLKGLVYGFITREDAERVLIDQPLGAFVIRFSDRVAGKVAITYKSMHETQEKIKHYLLNPGKELVTLPDFLQQRETFTHLLKLKTAFDCVGGPIEGLMLKDEAMKEFYTRNMRPLDGYVEDIPL